MKIALIGYGRMGHMIEACAIKRGHEIVARIDVGDKFDVKDADVAIEFTTPSTAEANIRKAWAAGVPVVSGTTGIDGQALMAEEGHPGLDWRSNFSEGMNLVFDFMNEIGMAVRKKGLGYKASITETHHIHKLDKPSGTAKTIAQELALFGVKGNGPDGQIEIESIREGEVPGIHTVTLDSDEDTIIVTHIAKGREGFALGAVIAAEELAGKR